MKERGLLLTKDNRQRSRDGDKTATRRVIVPQPVFQKHDPLGMREDNAWRWRHYAWKDGQSPNVLENMIRDARFAVGDRLYMLEPYRVLNKPQGNMVHGYYCDDNIIFDVELQWPELERFLDRKKPYAKTSSMFMYKSLARTWFEVTGVKVERVQDISDADCIAEGVEEVGSRHYRNYNYPCPDQNYYAGVLSAKVSFETLWDSINKKRGYGWEVNPWVWCISFERTKP